MGVEFVNPDQENKFYTLSNEVLPTDYPEVYEELLSCYCVQLTRTAYHFNDHYLCQDCYDTSDPDEQDLYNELPRHYMCGLPIRAAHCRLCDIHIAQIQPAVSCPECIDVYLDLTQTEKNFLDQGVITRAVTH